MIQDPLAGLGAGFGPAIYPVLQRSAVAIICMASTVWHIAAGLASAAAAGGTGIGVAAAVIAAAQKQ